MPVRISRPIGTIVYSGPLVATIGQAITAIDANAHISWGNVNIEATIQIYAYNASRQLWTRPTGHTKMFIYCLGSGAGGGSGYGGTDNAGGGGGGGSGAAVSWEGPALWDNLWAFVSPGGTSGNPGALSYVSTYDTSTTADLLIISGAVVPEHGGPGISDAGGGGGGIGGTAGTVSLPTSLGKLGTSIHYAGVLGAYGGNYNAVSPSLIALAGGSTTGGTGGGGHFANGGGQQYAGGDITGAGSLISTIAGGIVPGGDGNPGYSTLLDGIMPLSTGGSGGGARSGAGAGGVGGAGGYGSGGGGGGAGYTTGGAGGIGGDGSIIIKSW